MRLLDLFCCQGGSSAGYSKAGFDVDGVDIEPQPRYPFQFQQGDALDYVIKNLRWIRRYYDAVHASPPCQRYSLTQRIQGNEHPDLIAPARAALEQLGLPYVIENVELAAGELHSPVTLCGAMFGLRTYRHRLFEAGGGFVLPQPPEPQHFAPNAKMGRQVKDHEFMHVVGNFSGVGSARQIMDMPWASRDGLREAIPPVYAEWVGHHLAGHVSARGVLARAGQ